LDNTLIFEEQEACQQTAEAAAKWVMICKSLINQYYFIHLAFCLGGIATGSAHEKYSQL
jgi:hypothetical protein